MKSVIRFGGYRLDGGLRRLTLEASGDVVPLGSRAFAVLLHLAGKAGELATKAELMQAGWPDVTVEENSLTQCVSSLRKALGPAGSHIVTEAGRGYRFVATEAKRAEGREAWRTTDNAEAYQLFVSGWAAMTSPGAESVWLAIERLERAVQLDPDYAMAHALLGLSYACLGTFGYVRPRDILARADAPVRRALELDPALAEAHAALAHQQFGLELNLAEAARSLQRAEALAPESLAILGNMGGFMTMIGRFDEALAYFRRAQLAEPLAPNVTMGVGSVLYFSGRYHEAIALQETALELNPDFALAHAFIGRCCLRLGDYERAIAEFNACKHPTAGSAADLPSAYALAGRTEEARAALDALKTAASNRYVSPFDIAVIHTALGETAEALSWLERAVEDGAPLAGFLKVDPALASLRSEPRFVALLKRIGVD